MGKKMTVMAQIGSGFGILVVILLLVSLISFGGLRSANRGFLAYRELARDTNLAGRIQANMLLARIYVKDFLLTRADRDVELHQERFGMVREFLQEAQDVIQNPERAKHVDLMDESVGEYSAAFTDVVDLMKQRDDLVYQALEEHGRIMGDALSEIMVSAFADNDVEAGYYAGLIQEHALLARLFVMKFVDANDPAEVERFEREIGEEIDTVVGQLDAALQNAARRQLLSDFLDARAAYREDFQQLTDIIQRRNALIDNTLDRVGPVVSDAAEAVKLSVQGEQDQLGPQVQADNAATLRNMLIVSALSVLAGIALSFIISRMVTRPLGGEPRDMAELARQIAAGNLDVQVNTGNKAAQGLLADMLQMTDRIKTVLAETEGMIAAIQAGRLDQRGNMQAFQGGWRDLVGGMNNVVDAMMAPFNVATEYIDRIAKGDIPEKITDAYAGDFNEMKKNINELVENLQVLTDAANAIAAGDTSIQIQKRSDQDHLSMAFQHMISTVTSLILEMNALAEAGVEGKLDTRGDASRFQGDFARIVQGVNATLDAVIGPLNVAAEYVDRISHGDIPEPITQEYNGDFNEIKKNLNQCIAAISGLAAEAGRLTDAAVAGELDTRGDAAAFQGEFAGIVRGVNNTLDAVIGPLNVAAEYMDRISKGDIPDHITETYRGDFNEIKNNINMLIDAMRTVTDLAEDMARGNLDVEVVQRSAQDTLMKALNDMVTRLNGVVADVKTAAGNVAGGSQAMSSGAEEMSQGATEQASAAEEASSSMEEMAANIRQNSENAMQTEKIAIKAAEDARESGVAVDEAVNAMREITKRILVVEDISRQTRMLSLNATIEAARAQEHGKGFSVVAAEVRALAERSQTAANEVNGLATSSLKVAERAGDMLKRLVPDIQKTSELVQEITAASREQTSGTQQINRAIQQLDNVTQQNSATSEEIAATAEELASQADMLRQTIAFFQVRGGDEEDKTVARTAREFRENAVAASQFAKGPKAAASTQSDGNGTPVHVDFSEHQAPREADDLDDGFERY